MYRVLIALLILSTQTYAQATINLLGNLDLAGSLRSSGLWHYVHASGNEYALLGYEDGIKIIDVTDGTNPIQVAALPGVLSLWHEVKVFGDYAYAVSEGLDPNNLLNGVQILDLRYLPDSVPFKFYTGDGAILNQLSRAHTITAADSFLYINGHNITALNRGVIIASIADPWNPVYIGADTLDYCHDSYVRGNFLYTSDIYIGNFKVFDIADKSNPILLASQETPNLFNHNTWLNDSANVLFTTDERPGAPLAAYDISDLNSIKLLDTYITNNTPNGEVHNVRVLNDYLVCPSYGSKVTIVEVASFNTGTWICWDADPFLPNGKMIASDGNNDLFVFSVNYQRACYLEGLITDSATHLPINGASISITATTASTAANIFGNYATGWPIAGLYDVTVSAVGYFSKTITNVSLNSGLLTTLNVELVNSNIGVDDFSRAGLGIYPNPVRKYLQVKSQGGQPAKLSVYDDKGILLLTKLQTSTLNLEFLAPGIYYLVVELNNQQYSTKVVKLSN
jgi:choice-of-anchor B domain-containing protein